MSKLSINSVPMSFCPFGSLILGFLVVFVLVLLSEGILVSCFLVGYSYCQLILLYTCRSYIFYFNKLSKSSLRAPFVFHASFFCGFHFDFFSACHVNFGSPGCKHESFHLIFTTASVSGCLTSSTTFPWHQTYIHSHSSSVYSHNHNMSIPHGEEFNLLPSNIFQVNCCTSLNWSPIPSSSKRSISL